MMAGREARPHPYSVLNLLRPATQIQRVESEFRGARPSLFCGRKPIKTNPSARRIRGLTPPRPAMPQLRPTKSSDLTYFVDLLRQLLFRLPVLRRPES